MNTQLIQPKKGYHSKRMKTKGERRRTRRRRKRRRDDSKNRNLLLLRSRPLGSRLGLGRRLCHATRLGRRDDLGLLNDGRSLVFCQHKSSPMENEG